MQNIDSSEVQKFNHLAQDWWDRKGPLKTLHEINPLRVDFIESETSINNKTILDVGCGGGILSEALAIKGAKVTAIDMAENSIAIAKQHALENNVNIEYRNEDVEAFAKTNKAAFDIITCFELLEHVPHPEQLIQTCAKLLKPGGYFFLSTLNRNTKAYLQAILGAEYLLKLLPKGTHDYKKFIKPSELENTLRNVDCKIKKMAGLTYRPISKTYLLTDDISVNYLVCAQKKS